MKLSLLLTGVLLAMPLSASAHYNMLFPATASAEKDKEVKLTYQWGHPFEHELFDAPKPESLIVIGPEGKKSDLLESLKAINVKGAKKDVTAYELSFKPPDIGDYVFVLKTPAIWMAAEGEFYQDTVKVVLHVQAQKGWDQGEKSKYDFVPLTRPYGLVAGTVFQVRLLYRAQLEGRATSDADKPVEIERYNAIPPKELPADEFITRVVKTDPGGVVTSDLPEAGWWCFTAAHKGAMKDHDGTPAPIRERTTFWVYVADKAKP